MKPYAVEVTRTVHETCLCNVRAENDFDAKCKAQELAEEEEDKNLTIINRSIEEISHGMVIYEG